MLARAPFVLFALPFAVSCAGPYAPRGYDEDRAFLREHTTVHELRSGTGAVLVCPELQGRVMTSATRLDGPGLGFVNRPVVAHPDPDAAFVNFGGVERFWLGPEGGPWALFFDADAPQDREHWRTPEDLQHGGFAVVARDDRRVAMERELSVTNALGTRFDARVRRIVEAPPRAAVAAALGDERALLLPWTAWRSTTTVTNVGAEPWTEDGGLVCTWMLGTYRAGERTWAILPFRPYPAEGYEDAPPVLADYFGQVPPDRFRIGPDFAVLKADAGAVGKAGVLRSRARDRIGSYDPDTGVLTVVVFAPLEHAAPYLVEHWGWDVAPVPEGDVVNAYVHGGPEPFYELETSSPALRLGPGESQAHVQLVVQVEARGEDLDRLLRTALGVDPAEYRALTADPRTGKE